MISFPKFGVQVGDSLRADGNGGTLTEAQYTREKERRRGVVLKDFTHEEAKRHQDNLRYKGITEKE